MEDIEALVDTIRVSVLQRLLQLQLLKLMPMLNMVYMAIRGDHTIDMEDMEVMEDTEAMVDTIRVSVLPMLDICLDMVDTMDVIVVSVLQRLDMEETMDVMVVTLVDLVDMGMADMASGAKKIGIGLP